MRDVRLARRAPILPLLMVLALTQCALRAPLQDYDASPIDTGIRSRPVRVSDGADEEEDPTVVLARDGRFHVVWWAKRRDQVDLFIRSSRDGQTWSDEHRITDDPVADYYPALVQSRDGTLHLTWFRLEGGRKGRRDIWYARSADGAQWSRPRRITNAGQDWAPAIYEDARGLVWIVWSSNRTGNRELFAAYSADGGARWMPASQLTRSPEEDDFPHVLQTPGGERLLVWTRYRHRSRLQRYYRDPTAEVVLATSRDGLFWSAPVTWSPADPSTRYVDFLPNLFRDHDRQRVFLSWTSSRPDARGDILVRELSSQSSPIQQLTTVRGSDYDAKIVPTPERGEYLMVWTGRYQGKLRILARRFRL
jgi:hypothetical protein